MQTIHLESKVKTREIQRENARREIHSHSHKKSIYQKKTDILCFAKLDQKEKLLLIEKGV